MFLFFIPRIRRKFLHLFGCLQKRNKIKRTKETGNEKEIDFVSITLFHGSINA